jgi:hypothetical protein
VAAAASHPVDVFKLSSVTKLICDSVFPGGGGGQRLCVQEGRMGDSPALVRDRRQ